MKYEVGAVSTSYFILHTSCFLPIACLPPNNVHPPLLLDSQLQLRELLGRERSGRLRHQVRRRGGLGERNHVADRLLARKQHHEPVQTERDAPVRRRAEVERVEEEAKAA